MVGGVCGWGARWLPSRPLVLFVYVGLWPGGVGRWAVVVMGVVLVVVVVGPLVVVVWVVVGLVLRVWPVESLWVFRSPLWGWGVGHRGQSPGLVSAASPICSDFQTFCPDWLHFGHFLCFGGIAASQLSHRIFPIYF